MVTVIGRGIKKLRLCQAFFVFLDWGRLMVCNQYGSLDPSRSRYGKLLVRLEKTDILTV